MPRNSSGVYSPPSGTLAVTATTIASTPYNNFVNDVASALTGSLPRDGSAGMLASMPMGGNKITGLAAGTAAGDAMRFEQFFSSGTLMLFQQSSAPISWTKQVTHNNKALRVVSGSVVNGGTANFTTVFGNRTIATANLPNINISLASLTGAVNTSITNGGNVYHANSLDGFDPTGSVDIGANGTISTLSLASGAVNFGGNLPLGGSGTAMNFDVAFVDLIIAAKD